MKVSCGDDKFLFGKHIGIVGYTIDLCKKDVCNMVDRVSASAMNLRDTTERIRILYVLFTLSDQLASFKVFTNIDRHLTLTFMRSYFVHLVEERFDASVKYIQRKR